MPALNESEFGNLTQTPHGILRILGGFGNVSGPGLVLVSYPMFRSMVAGSSSAMIVGLAGTMVSSMIWGTATLPFIICSSIGFFGGSLRWYMVSSQEALQQLDRYPALLRMHVIANFPWLPEYARYGPAWYTSRRFGATWVRKSILVASWLSAQPALDEIHQQAEAAIVQEYAEGREREEEHEKE